MRLTQNTVAGLDLNAWIAVSRQLGANVPIMVELFSAIEMGFTKAMNQSPTE